MLMVLAALLLSIGIASAELNVHSAGQQFARIDMG